MNNDQELNYVSDSGSDMSSGIGFWMDWDYGTPFSQFYSWSDGIIMIDTPLLVIVMKSGWVQSSVILVLMESCFNRHPDLLEIWMP